MDYAEAVNRLNDELSSIIARAERHGLSNKEIVEELRRVAAELEKENA